MKLALFTPTQYDKMETFVKAHSNYLSNQTYLFNQGFFPEKLFYKTLIDTSIKSRLLNKIISNITNFNYPEFKLQKVLKKLGIEVALAEFGPTGVAIQAACKMANVPLVVHFHGADISKKDLLTKYLKSYKTLFDTSDAIVAVSHKMKNDLIAYGAPANKITVNPCGVDIDLFGPRQVDKEFDFIFVGRFVDKKAPIYLLSSFKKYLTYNPSARLCMVGSGPLYDSAQHFIRAWNMGSNVILKDNLAHEEVSSLMQKSKIYIQHSVTASDGDTEGTPVSILEAMASCLPVISTKHAGINDVITNGKHGFLVDEGDTEAMAAKMNKLFTSSSNIESMGQSARKNVIENYSMEKSIDRLRSVLESAII